MKNLAPDPSRSENSSLSRYEFLFKQATTLLKWINLKTDDVESEEALRNGLQSSIEVDTVAVEQYK